MSQLEDLLQQCTVKLTLPGRMGWGTGFFVAPEWILTCAHVVQEAKEPIQIQWQSQENWLQAVVERSLPNPYDLALLRVTLPAHANPPCVYLDAEVKSRDPLYLFGYPDEGDRQGEPRTFNCDGITGSAIASILFNLGQVRPGMSGSPLLNQRTGKVCGIVKFTRDRSSDLGGGAIPTHVILEQFPELRDLQREFHEGDRRWSDLLPTTNHQGTTLDTERVKSYLRSLCQYYEQWWNRYRLTETISVRQATFTFEQTVQTEEVSEEASSEEILSEETPRENKTKENKTVSWGLLQGIIHYANKSEHVLLVGSPGTGKSTTLLRLWVVLAEQELRSTRPRIPVLVKLQDYQEPLPGTEDSSGMLTLIKEALEPELSLTISEIKTLLFQEKRLFLLLDGLNEIPASIVHSKLADFRAKCDRAKIPLVCTTRSSGDSLGIQRRLDLQSLSNPEIKRFLRECMPGQEEQVLKLLNKDNRELGKTPFVLWMLYDISKNSDPVPESLGEAFRRFTKSYTSYKINHEGIPVPPEDLEYWNLLLEYLAFEMLRSPDPHNPGLMISEKTATGILLQFPSAEAIDQRKAQVLLKNLLKYHLLEGSHKGEVSFCHQLIQEYYAAEHLLQQLPTLLEDEDKFKREYLNYWKWTEAIALMLALVDEEAQAVRVVKLALDVDFRLGARLTGEVALDFQKATVEEVVALPVADWLKVELLGETQSKVAIPELLSFLTHSNINIAKVAASYIEETSNQAAIDDLTKRLEEISTKFFSQTSWGVPDETGMLWTVHIQALSYLSSQAAIRFLREKLKEHNTLILMTIQAAPILMQLDAKNIISELLKEFWDAQHEEKKNIAVSRKETEEELQTSELKNSTIHSEATVISGRPKTIRFTPLSPERLRRNDILNFLEVSSSYELFIPALIQAFEQEIDESIQSQIIQILGKSKHNAAIHLLIQILAIDSRKLRSEAAKQLIKLKSIDNSDSYEELSKLTGYEDWNVSWCASVVLGHLRDSRVLPRMMYELENHEIPGIRSTAAKVLGIIGDPSCIPSLLKAIRHDSDRYVRLNAACTLSYFDQKEAIPTLLDALKLRTNADPHIEIMRSIAKFGIKEPLLEIVKTKDFYWQTAVVELGKLTKSQKNNKELVVLSDLFSALVDPGHESSDDTIELLSELADPETLSCLITALEHPEKYTRDIYFSNRVALVLVRCHPEVLADKLPTLRDLNKKKDIQQLSWLIPTIQNRCKYYNHEIAHGLIPQGQAIALFFSYASKDEALQNELAKHLNLLERQGIITSWDSRQILPGDEQEQVTSQQLNTADIILLLISSDSIADNTCYNLEIRRAMERHQSGEAHVIPILLRPVDWAGAPFSQLPVLPKSKQPVTTWDNQDEAFREIAEGIRAVAIGLRRENGIKGA